MAEPTNVPGTTYGATGTSITRTTRFPEVKGKCPACGASSLFLGAGGYVTCGYLPCPNPGAATDLLFDRRF